MSDHETESSIQAKILELGRGPCRLFRVNTGLAWQGHGRAVDMEYLGVHGKFIPRARPVRLMPPGSPDIAGAVSVVITQDMVGARVAIAVGIEVKAGRGKLSAKQVAAMRQLHSMGARAGMARSVEEAKTIILGDYDE